MMEELTKLHRQEMMEELTKLHRQEMTGKLTKLRIINAGQLPGELENNKKLDETGSLHYYSGNPKT